MSNYIAAAGKGIAEGVKKEWERATTFGGVIEYAAVGRDARPIYAASRVVLAAGAGAYRAVKEVRAERRPVELHAVPDAEEHIGRHRKGA